MDALRDSLHGHEEMEPDRARAVIRARRIGGISTGESIAMKTSVALLAAAMLTLAAGSAEAKGCIKGAVVGGVAGHYAGHHGLLGAAAGCLYGRHEANKRDQQQQIQGQGQAPADPNKL